MDDDLKTYPIRMTNNVLRVLWSLWQEEQAQGEQAMMTIADLSEATGMSVPLTRIAVHRLELHTSWVYWSGYQRLPRMRPRERFSLSRGSLDAVGAALDDHERLLRALIDQETWQAWRRRRESDRSGTVER